MRIVNANKLIKWTELNNVQQQQQLFQFKFKFKFKM